MILPLVFPDFHKRYPNVNIRVKIGMTSKMTSMVQSGGLESDSGRESGDHAWI